MRLISLLLMAVAIASKQAVLMKSRYFRAVSGEQNAESAKNSLFITEEFFSNSDEDAFNVLLKTGNKEKNGRDMVFRQVEMPKLQENPMWSEWVYSPSGNETCGTQTRVRYCYHSYPCKGESRRVEKCNTEEFPDLQNCSTSMTSFSNLSNKLDTYEPLVGQNLSCQGGVIASVKIVNAGYSIGYNYTCCNFKFPVCTLRNASTIWNAGGAWNPSFLDRHQITCGEHSMLRSFQLEKAPSQDRIRYLMTCCDISDAKWKSKFQCIEKRSNEVENEKRSILALVSTPVICDNGYGLSYLLLAKNMSNSFIWGYNFRCCKIVH